MKAPFGCLLFLLPLTLGAQELVTLGQSLTLSMDADRSQLGDTRVSNSFMLTDYNFDLGMPLFTYRLGTLNLGGGLAWMRRSGEDTNTTASGLNALSLSGSLFPFQPYHLNFDYARITPLSFFKGARARTDTWGLGYSSFGSLVQSLRMDYRHSTTVAGPTRDAFSSFNLTDEQHRGSTDLQLRGNWQEYTAGNVAWRTTGLSASAYTPLGSEGSFQNNLSAQFDRDNRQLQLNSNLAVRSGGWTSLTSLSSTLSTRQDETFRSLGVGQSLAHTWGRLSGFASTGLAVASASGDVVSSPPSAHLTMGAIYRLAQGWWVSGDVSGSWVRNQDGAGGTSPTGGQGHTFHAGLAWGGGLPEQLAHALFYWTNLRFQRRLEDDYPPGYLPPDMTRLLLRRRQMQSGSLNFSADIYRTDKDRGHETWVRTRGGLNLRTGFMLQIMGDLRKAVGGTDPNLQVESRNFTLVGMQRMGQGSVNFSIGHFWNVQATGSTSLSDGTPMTTSGTALSTASTSYSLGANGALAGIPLGAILNRNIEATGLITNNLSTYAQAVYGRVQVRVTYQHGWWSSGFRGDQISLSLGRAFDTIPLWGFEE